MANCRDKAAKSQRFCLGQMVKMEKYNTSGFYQCAMSCCSNPAGVAQYNFSSLTPILDSLLKREISAQAFLLISHLRSPSVPLFSAKHLRLDLDCVFGEIEFGGLVFSVNPVHRLT